MDLPSLTDTIVLATAALVVGLFVALRTRGRRALWLPTLLVVGPAVLVVLVRLRQVGGVEIPLTDEGNSGTYLDVVWIVGLVGGAAVAVEALMTLRMPRPVVWVLVWVGVIFMLGGAFRRWIA